MRKLYTSLFSLLFASISFAQIDLQNGLIGDYQFNNNANDLSGNSNNGTVTGAALTLDRLGYLNSAYSFNGSSDYISLPVNDFLLDNFTYSVWVYVDAIPSANSAVSILTIGQTAGDQGIFLGNQYPSQAYQTGFFIAGNNSSTTNSSCYEGTLPATTTWYHLAMVRSSTEIKLYIDGALVKTSSVPNAAYYGAGNNQKAIIGARSHGNMQYFDGKIDDLKIYNRALSDCEISALALQTPMESLIGDYQFDGNADDESSSNNHGTVTGAVLTTDRFGHANSAYSFNGTSDYISLPANNFLTDNFTYSVWVNVNNIPAVNNVASIISIGKIAGDQGIFLGNQYPSGSNQTGFFVAGNNSSSSNSSSYAGTLPSTSTWYHVVMVRSSSEMKLFINGVLIKSTTVPNEAYYGTGTDQQAIIGARSHDNKHYFNGKIDDVKIFNRELADCEVSDLYDEEKVVTSNLSPSLNEAVKLYPNPAEGNLSIEYPDSYGSSTITIHNSLGLTVFSGNMNATHNIELQNLPSGVYILKLKTEEGKEMNRKFIIR